MDWALSSTDWRLIGSSEIYNINDIESDEKKLRDFKDKAFYKERWIKENGLEQRLIVTYSLKYKNYQRKIRNAQIDRAQKALNDANFKLDRCKQTDYKRFIKKTNVTKDGEVADSKILTLDNSVIEKEEKYTCEEIIDTLREMLLVEEKNGNEYTPAYTRTDLTDELHDKFGFRTDFEITSKNKMKKILKNIRN